MKGQLKNNLRNKNKNDLNTYFRKAFELILEPYIDYNISEGQYTTSGVITTELQSYINRFKKDLKKSFKGDQLKEFVKEYNLNKNNKEYITANIMYVSKFLKQDTMSQFDEAGMKQLMQELVNLISEIAKIPQETYSIERKYVIHSPNSGGEMDEVAKEKLVGLSKDEYEKIKKENESIEKKYGKDYARYGYNKGGYYDFEGVHHPDKIVKETFEPVKDLLKKEKEVDWDAYSDEEEEAIEKPKNTAMIQIIKDPNKEKGDRIYNMLEHDSEFQNHQQLFSKITGMILELKELDRVLSDFNFFKTVVREAIRRLRQPANEIKESVINEIKQSENRVQLLGEIKRDRVVTQPNERLKKTMYSESFQNYIKERGIEIPVELFEESKLLQENFGNRALVQTLGDSNLIQIRADYEYPGKLFYHGRILIAGSVVYVPLLWLEYTHSTKLNASPQEKIFRYMSEEDGLIILAKTQLSSTLVSQLLEKGNRTTFLGTVFYIINNPDKLVVNKDFKSVELVMKQIDKDNSEKIEKYNNTLLQMNNHLLKIVMQNVKNNTNPLLEMYNKVMDLTVFNKKYTKEFIMKIFSDPLINRAYNVELLTEEEAGLIPYIDKLGDNDLTISVDREFVVQSSYGYVRPSTLADIVKVFPKERLEDVNTGLLRELFQTFNHTNEEYLKKFKHDVEHCLETHLNGNYSQETAILRHLQVYLESATNQYNRMNPDQNIYDRIFEIYPESPLVDIENSYIYQIGMASNNPDVNSLKYTFNSKDILMRLVVNEEFLDEYLNEFYYPVSNGLKEINPDLLAHVDNYIKIEDNSYRLISVNKQSKGLVVNKTKRSDTWISELMLANQYYIDRLGMSKSPGSYSFAKIKNEVQEIGKLPRNFQTILAYTQAHAQMVSIMSKAHLRRIDKGGSSLIGFPLMGSLFDELLKIIDNMSKGDTYMFNFSDNLYIVQRTEEGNIVYISLDLVKGESSTYLATAELMYRKWEKQFGVALSDNYKAYLKLFLLDQTTMKTLMPASERDVYATSTRYLVTGSVVTTDCNHENTNLVIFLTHKLNINPIIKKEKWELNPKFIDLCASIGMRFEIAHLDDNFLKNYYEPTEMMFSSKTLKMDMLGYNAVKLYDKYVPILEYNRFIKQICYNKSGETEDSDVFYDYMRYRALVMSGYLYKCSTLIYNFLLGRMHVFNKNNLEGQASEIVEKISGFYKSMLDIADLGDQFYDSVSKPYLESMKFLLPPGIVDVVKIVSSKNFGLAMETKIINEYRSLKTSISPIDALTILGDRVYEPAYSDLYVSISRDLNLLLSKQYNILMKEIKSKIVGPVSDIRPTPFIKISVANLEADLVFLKTQILRVQVFKNALDFSVMKWLFLGEPLDKTLFKDFKLITLFFSVLRIVYLMVLLRAKKQEDVNPTYQKMLKIIFKIYNLQITPAITYKKTFPFLGINFKGIVKNNPSSTIKVLLDLFSTTYGSLTVQTELTKIVSVVKDIFKSNMSETIEIEFYTSLKNSKMVYSSPEFLTLTYFLYGMTELGPYMSLIPKYNSAYKLLASTRMIYNKAQILEVPKFTTQNNSGLNDFQILLSFSLPYEVNVLLSKRTSINTWKINTIQTTLDSLKTHPLFIKNKIANIDDVLNIMRETLSKIIGVPYEGPLDEETFSFDDLEIVDVQSNLPEDFNVPIDESVHPSYHRLIKTIVYSVYYGGANTLMDLFEREWAGQPIVDRFRLFAVYGHLTPRISDRLISYYIVENYEFFQACNILTTIQDINPLYKHKKGLLFNPVWVNSYFAFCVGDLTSILNFGRQPLYNVFVDQQELIAYNNDNNIGLNVIAYKNTTLESLRTKYLREIRNKMIGFTGIPQNKIVKVKTAKFRDLRLDVKNEEIMSENKRNIERVFHHAPNQSLEKVEEKVLDRKSKKKLRDPIFETVPHRFIKYDSEHKVYYDTRIHNHLDERIKDKNKIKKLNAMITDKPKVNFIYHEHVCKFCQKLYRHIHNKGMPEHGQFDFQCPWEDCKMYFMLGDKSQQLNITEAEKIREVNAMNSVVEKKEKKNKSPRQNDTDIKIESLSFEEKLFDLQFKPQDIHTKLDHTISFSRKSINVNAKVFIYKNKWMQKIGISLYDKKLKNQLFRWNIHYDSYCPLVISTDRIQVPAKYIYLYLMNVYVDRKDVYLNVLPGIEWEKDNIDIPLIYEGFTELEILDTLQDARDLLEVRDTIGDLTFIEMLKLEELEIIEKNEEYFPPIYLVKDVFGSILP